MRGKYDYVFILDKHYYFNFIGRIICKKVVGYVREDISQIFLRYFVKYNDVMRYHGLYYLDLLTASGLAISNYTDYKLDFKINEEIIPNIKRVIHEYKLVPDEFIIIVNSGGNNQFESGGIRMLPEDKILRLIQLAAKQRKVVLLGSKVDEINYNNYLKNVHTDNVINLAGKLSLQQSATLMRLANKIYTTDCGAMHIAISQNLCDKLCCFFGPTCPNHVLPPGMGIEYYWDDNELFDRNYPLYGIVPNKSGYFRKLDIDKLFIDNTDETKKLY
jgi:ADP-heptose:LPS heptosyltransferase